MSRSQTAFARNMRKAARALLAAARAHDAEFGELHARAVTPGGMALDMETRLGLLVERLTSLSTCLTVGDQVDLTDRTSLVSIITDLSNLQKEQRVR
jgi:hypothetical protein